ncbi:MAG TPA: zinc dependent phospholipase C family protein [Cyclobacteriaceae bacterium]|nr:zinc dependent phospholipase C family protein [Cyclobacteriaceae bacterium]
MKNHVFGSVLLVFIFLLHCSWGFYAHKQINRLAVFTLPGDMIGFYKKNIQYITDAAVNPDRRRYAVPDEAPRHYIDLDHYGDSALYKMPSYWKDAVAKHTEDTLKVYGIVPWHVNVMFYRLRDAFMTKDPARILNISADLGHYIADAHVPLHTTENYNGQLTGQHGIHAFWESRLPELFDKHYDFFVGKAEYVKNPQLTIWKAIEESNQHVDSVLAIEKRLTEKFGEKKYSFETKGKQTMKVYAVEFSTAYHEALRGMVEQRMRGAIEMTGDFWYTAWVDAGQPDLKSLINYKPTAEEIAARRKELEEWKQERLKVREHESESNQ